MTSSSGRMRNAIRCRACRPCASTCGASIQPVTRIETFDGIVAPALATRRFTLVLLASFAGTA